LNTGLQRHATRGQRLSDVTSEIALRGFATDSSLSLGHALNFVDHPLSMAGLVALTSYFFLPIFDACCTYSASVMIPSLSISQKVQFFSAMLLSL